MAGIALNLFWIVPLILLIAFLSSPRFRGDIAETRTRRVLASGLEKRRYSVVNDLLIPSGGGSIEIDHVVLSKYGIFVIESQYRKGWISGTEVQERWNSSSLGGSTRFDNPMHLNFRQKQALASLLGLPESRFHEVVVMTGHKGFRKGSPEKLIGIDRLIPYVRKKGQQVLSDEAVAEAFTVLADTRYRKRSGNFWAFARFILLAALLGGLYLSFGDDINRWWQQVEHQAAVESSPADFKADGSVKSEREKWEDRLICVYSADSGRCVCHEPESGAVDLEFQRCKDLAERGSILKQ